VRFCLDFHQTGGDLFHDLLAQAHIPVYRVRWRRRPNGVAIGDNRSTQHLAVMDSPPGVRKVDHASIEGDIHC